ncbi:M16 family metallopeptidase [Streptosporangium saharense]|uniref:Putative Zn-dependent peptidase n=1 Tax=Streptosporangium saharense TaxID=1706840 RepID=A0A7W7QKC4_9ACTN|nr:pitrilysin family protein [Streptosporangium saharense]MBB4915205.1 putative Zn-dependent peptidase [Streptosporangium saharense]
MSASAVRPLPDLEPAAPLVLPRQAEAVLPSGLTVIAIARRTTPLVEARLWVPMAEVDIAEGALLAQTLFSGTGTRSATGIAEETQAVGGSLNCGASPDRWLINGDCLASGLDRLLEVLADALCDARYPDREFSVERDRLADRFRVSLSQPPTLARTALLRRVYGDHPYAVETPDPERVGAVEAERVRDLHERRMRPDGAALVLVGDLDPEEAIELAGRRLGRWTGSGRKVTMPPAPSPTPGPLLLVDRPGTLQSSLRFALPAPGRDHPDSAAMQLANLVFGGYFSSRWTENLREDKGYSYGPGSVVDHSLGGSAVMIAADVATEVTAPALVETLYELGRIATLPPEPEEVEQARRYAIGGIMVATATQAGLARFAGTLAGFGLRLDHLALRVERLAAATVEDVHRVASTYLGPGRATAVLLGDAERVERGVASVMPVEIG